MKYLSVVLTCLAVVVLAITTTHAFRLPFYAQNDPYLKQILTPLRGAQGPNQYQLYMAREYLDELEPFDQDPHDIVERHLEPDFF